LVSETLAGVRRRAPLPVWLATKDTYRHLRRYRWPYFWQIVLWALIFWIAQILASIVTAFMSPQGRAIFIVHIGTTIACLLAGGGAAFLSCGRAIMFDRKVRASDALRLHWPGAFWRTLALYWLIVHLVPTVGAHELRDYANVNEVSWPGYDLILAGYWAWTLLTAPLLVLALPIAAFEPQTSPIREAWTRLRGNRVRMALLALAAAAPVVAIQLFYDHGRAGIPDMLSEQGRPGMMTFLEFFMLQPARGALSFLLILVLGAAVMSAYMRLSPRFEHVARVFD